MKEVYAKTILTKVNPSDEFWFHHDYNMNLYRGCSHGCIYCDSRSDCYHVKNFDEVAVKKDALKIFEIELIKKRNRGIIGMGAMSDPYNPFELKLEVTRGALQLIEQYGFSVSLATKSILILRDLDILTRIAKNHTVHVAITITTSQDELQKKIEPHVASSSQRFEALKQLRDAGIHAGILMMPVLPYINDTLENVLGMVEKASIAKAEYIYPYFGVTLRSNQRDYFYEQIDKQFPGIKQKYISRFGERYACDSPDSKELYLAIKEACLKEGILTSMKDINRNIFRLERKEQLSLF